MHPRVTGNPEQEVAFGEIPNKPCQDFSSCAWKSFLILRNISHVYFWLALYFPDTRWVKSYLMPEKLLTEGVGKGVSGCEIQAAPTLPLQQLSKS